MPCENCPSPVWGELVGDNSTIMFVGEALGKVEAEKKRPFVGPSGRFLRDTCRINGIKDYYLANVVKCLCNGRPSGKKQQECQDYLLDEIFANEPKIIVPLGNTALKRIVGRVEELGDPKISRYRGKIIPCNFRRFHFIAIPTYHPSPKNGHLTRDFLNDFRLIKKEYERSESDGKMV